MKILVYRNDEEIDSTTIGFMDDNVTDDAIMKDVKALWAKAVNDRDNYDGIPIYKIRAELDSTAHNAVILSFNVNKFLEFMTYLLNGYIPRIEGIRILSAFYFNHFISMPRMMMAYKDTGKYPSIMQSECGIYAFHFYPGLEWSNLSMSAVGGVGMHTSYDICDYSVITDAVRQCPAGSRPMVWINPYICVGFQDVSESDLNYSTINTYTSSLIIVSALETEAGSIDNTMATQLWSSLKTFLENGGAFADIKGIYDSAEQLLLSR